MVNFTQHTINTPYMVGPVHCYSATINGELTLFDTGPPTEEASSYLEEHIDLDKLRHVIITHCHIDHYGQAMWLEKRGDATIYLPFRDSLKTSLHGKRMHGMYRILGDLGFGTAYLEELQKIFNTGAILPPFPKNYKIAEQRSADKKYRREDNDRNKYSLFLFIKPRCNEHPELINYYRSGKHNTG